MKKTTVKASDLSALHEWLTAVQYRSKTRTIWEEDIVDACESVTKRLGISKKAMTGVEFSADCNAQVFPKAYKYSPESTIFYARFNGKEWVITDIRRETCRRPTVGTRVTLTDTAREAIIARMESFELY